MKNRAPLSENIRKWGWLRTWTHLAWERGYHGTDKKPEGLSSKGEISISIWSFSHLTLGICVYLSSLRGRYVGSPERIVPFEDLVQGTRACGMLGFKVKKKEKGRSSDSALNNATECVVCMCMSMSEGVGRGRALFLSLEPGYPLLCPHTHCDELSLCPNF